VEIIDAAEKCLVGFKNSKKRMEATYKLLTEHHELRRDAVKNDRAAKDRFHGEEQALGMAQITMSNYDTEIFLFEKILTTATFTKQLAERLLELQEECIERRSWPEEPQKKMTFIMNRLDGCWWKLLELMDKEGKQEDVENQFQLQVDNLVQHFTPQMREEADKILRNMKAETKQLKKKEKIAARRLTKKERR
jgi:hypothetical protein